MLIEINNKFNVALFDVLFFNLKAYDAKDALLYIVHWSTGFIQTVQIQLICGKPFYDMKFNKNIKAFINVRM